MFPGSHNSGNTKELASNGTLDVDLVERTGNCGGLGWGSMVQHSENL